MKIKVSVTQEDINLGKPGEANSCPIALALNRMGYKDVLVDDSIEVGINLKNRYTFELISPYLEGKAAEFIKNFDKGIPVTPFDFEIELEQYYEEPDDWS